MRPEHVSYQSGQDVDMGISYAAMAHVFDLAQVLQLTSHALDEPIQATGPTRIIIVSLYFLSACVQGGADHHDVNGRALDG